ncbi:MAG: TolC family protein [Desulfobacterales bacterium]|nr:TolC family protein [Desulfobacterales bacterium]
MTAHKRYSAEIYLICLHFILCSLFILPTVAPAQEQKGLRPERIYFSLQVASYQQTRRARQAVDRLVRQNYKAFYSGPDKRNWYRVCLGPFETRQEALDYKTAVKARGFPGKLLLVKTEPQYIVGDRPAIDKEAAPAGSEPASESGSPVPAVEEVELMPGPDKTSPAMEKKASVTEPEKIPPVEVQREYMPQPAKTVNPVKPAPQEVSSENKIYVHVFIDDYGAGDHKFSKNTATQPAEVFTLVKTVERALFANLGLERAKEETRATLSSIKVQRTRFLPTLNTTYQMAHNYEEKNIPFMGVTVPENEYTFAAKFDQPIFTGFSIRHQYDIAKISHEIAKMNGKNLHRQVGFEANKKFFSLLKAHKLFTISNETVTQLSAHLEVAKSFYAAGMIPLNDLLKTEVELANARQNMTMAQNNMEIAKSDFNTFLRRPIHESLELKDVLDYSPYEKDVDYCLREAGIQRMEIKVNELEIEIAEKELKLAQKDYYPSVNLQGNYYQIGSNWDLNGDNGINDPNGWNIRAIASWNIWEWGRTYHGVQEKMSRLAQVRKRRDEILDSIRFEVKGAFLKMKESEKNILTIKKAIEQAKENFRISQERYKEQVETSTDVLDAQTLLSKTLTSYFTALYDFKISRASLHNSMGQEIME